ncbi:MAG: hypothetical protein FJ272_00275, partial [Planctomycetes bacterium]|nr:hypothetical protein [Planctomycetota bacterium]
MEKSFAVAVCACLYVLWSCGCFGQDGRPEAGLVGYWPFDRDIKDASGDRHATGPKMTFAEGIKGKA